MEWEDSKGKKACAAKENMKGKYKIISLDRILDPEAPLRSDLSHEAVADLVQSIKEVGIIEPLVVRKKEEYYDLIAGHRRLVAAGIAGLTKAPCLIVEADDLKAEILKLHENLNRTDINPIDWAEHLQVLKKQFNLPSAKIAKRLGMSEAWVSQHLAILEYDAALLEALKNDMIAFSAARELSQIRDPKKRGVYVKHAVMGGVTPKLAARWRKEANREMNNQPKEPPKKEEVATPEVKEEALPECLVCREGIKPEEELKITIHQACQPQ